jgi:hypothetical protein
LFCQFFQLRQIDPKYFSWFVLNFEERGFEHFFENKNAFFNIQKRS